MRLRPGDDGRSKWWLTLGLFLLIAANWISDRLDAPAWIDVVLVAALVVVLPWVILTAIREVRDGGPG